MRLYSGKIGPIVDDLVRDLTAQNDIEVDDEAEVRMDLEAVLKEFVRRERSFLYDPRHYTTPEGRFSNEATLFLPLSEDGQTVSQILVYSLRGELKSEFD